MKKFMKSILQFIIIALNATLEVPSLRSCLCPYYRCLWGQCNDLQRRSMIHHVCCLGTVVAIKLTEQSSQLKIYHESDIPL